MATSWVAGARKADGRTSGDVQEWLGAASDWRRQAPFDAGAAGG